MNFLRLLSFFVLSLFFVVNTNAQTCTPPNEITITSWTNSSIDIEWTAVPNATQYSIEILDAATNTSIWLDFTPNNLYSIPPGLFNSLSEVIIILSAECAGVWHPSTIDIYGIPDVWIVYDKSCPEEAGTVFNPYQIRVLYPTPIYPSNYHLYDVDCFCPGIDNLEHHYDNDPTNAPYPVVINHDPQYLNLLRNGIRPLRYTSNIQGYFQALFDYNDFERYFAFHCFGLEPEYEEFEEGDFGKTSISQNETVSTTVYPNPASDGFTFENQDKRDATVVIYNLIGLTVMQFEVASESKNYITLPSVANGLLYLKLSYVGSGTSEIIPLNVIR